MQIGRVIAVVLAFVALLSAAACGSNNSNSTGTPSSTTGTGTTTTTTTTGATASASIVSGATVLTTTAFSPNPITIKVGDSVKWTNNDTIVHTSTANNGQWNSGILNPGQSFTTPAFTTAGSFQYHCTIHPGMVGTVTVQ